MERERKRDRLWEIKRERLWAIKRERNNKKKDDIYVRLSYEKDLRPFFHLKKTERDGVEYGKRERLWEKDK